MLKLRKARAQHWMNFAVGRSGFRLSAFANTRDNRIGVQFLIDNDNPKAWFHHLYQQREDIENEIGRPLDWQELPTKKRSQVNINKFDTDPWNRTDWPAQHKWLLGTLENFYKAFSPRIKGIELGI